MKAFIPYGRIFPVSIKLFKTVLIMEKVIIRITAETADTILMRIWLIFLNKAVKTVLIIEKKSMKTPADNTVEIM